MCKSNAMETMNVTSATTLHRNSQEQCEFEKVAVYFSEEEWDCLMEEEKELYREVMMENYQTLLSLGRINVTPRIVSMIMNGEEPFLKGRWAHRAPLSLSIDGTKNKTTTMKCAFTPEPLNCDRRLKTATSIKRPELEGKGHAVTRISRETPSRQAGDADLYRSAKHTQIEHPPARINEEQTSCDGADLADLHTCIPITMVPTSCEEGNPADGCIHTGPICTPSKEEPSSCEKELPVGFYPERRREGHPSTPTKQEPGSREEHLVKVNTHIDIQIKEEPTLFEEENPKDLYMPSEYPSICIKKEPSSWEGRNRMDISAECTERDVLPTIIKEEPASSEGNLRLTEHTQTEHPSNLQQESEATLAATYTPCGNTQGGHPDTHYKEEPMSYEAQKLTYVHIYLPADHTYTEYPDTHFKEEPTSCGGQPLMDARIYLPTDHTYTEYPETPFKEEPTSCEGQINTDHIYTEYPSDHLMENSNNNATDCYPPTPHVYIEYTRADMEEPISWKDGNLTEVYPLREHTLTEYPPTCITQEMAQCEGGLQETVYLLQLNKFQTENPSCIMKEPSVCEGGNLMDIYPQTEHLSTSLKEEPASCEGHPQDLYVLTDHTWADCPTTNDTSTKETQTECAYTYIIEDSSSSCDEGRLTNVTTSVLYTNMGCPSTHIKNKLDSSEGHLGGDGKRSSIKHTQTEFVPDNIDEDWGGEDDSSAIYTENYKTPNASHIKHQIPESPTNPSRNSQTNYKAKKRTVNRPQLLYLRSNVTPDIKPINTTFSCLKCHDSFPWMYQLADHAKTHLTFSCSTCKKSFNCKSHLADHEKTHSSGQAFKCPDCSLGLDSESEYVKHLKTHAASSSESLSDNNSIAISGQLRKSPRIEKLMSTKDYRVSYISKDTTSSEEDVPDNVAKNHEDCKRPPLKAFSCWTCKKSFKCRSHLADHEETHLRGQAFRCDSEYVKTHSAATSSKGLSDDHSVITGHCRYWQHTEKPGSTMDCCVEYASVAASLRDNRPDKNVLNQPPPGPKPSGSAKPKQSVVPSPSQKQFLTNEHVNTTPHSLPVKCVRPLWASKEKKKKLACLECGEEFTYNSDLLLHMKSHSGEKNPVCSVCGKAFRCFVDLVIHQKSSHRRNT